MQQSFNAYIENSIREHWELVALSDFKGVSYQYKDIARKIEKLHILIEAAGIQKGDKIAICGRNSSHWAVAFFATLAYGAVAVPILHEFKADNVHHIVINDFSVLISKKKSLTDAREHLNEYFGKKFPNRFTKDDVKYYEDQPDELALINYTSGSTGFSKGVMLSYRSIWSNLKFCLENLDFLREGDGTVSMLPMAHMYGLAVELMHPFAKGCHIHFLTRIPSPKIIMDAFAEVKPKLIVAVPLIIEKIIKTKVFPLLDKPLMKLMLMIPVLDTQLLSKIKMKLEETFGGNLHELIIGGAALNKEVEQFLKKINFPFTVGYGMTIDFIRALGTK